MARRISRGLLLPFFILLFATTVLGLVTPAEGIGVLTGCKVCRESSITDWGSTSVTYE